MNYLNPTTDHQTIDPSILLFGANIKLNGSYVWAYESLQWALWDGCPDTSGDVVLLLNKGIRVIQKNESLFEVEPPIATELSFASNDFEYKKQEFLDKANKICELAKQITELSL